MEQNQPLKKRIVEQQSFYPPQRTYVKSFTTQQRQSEIGPYYQYVPISESKPIQQQQQQQHQNLPNPQGRQQQHQQQIQEQHYESEDDLQRRLQQPLQAAPQIIQYEYYEAPMTLNAWTQTNPDDFPNPPPSIDSEIEASLLVKVEELEKRLKIQYDIINEIQEQNARTSSPEQVVSNSTAITPSEIKDVPRTYRILTQSNEVNNETQIEIQLSDDAENSNLNSSSPKVYTVHTSAPSVSEHIYCQKAIAPISKTSDLKKGATVSIGPNETKVPKEEYEKIPWTSASIATRKLLTAIFNRETLATHSMTGKPSPAFKDLNKPVKGKLDPNAIEDIIYTVSKKCRVSAKEVRSSITTKCADENKMLKMKQLKKLGSLERSPLTEINKIKKENKENS